MDIQEIQEKFEDLLLANPDFDESLLEKDEEGSYLDSDIQYMYSMFEAGTEVGEQWQAAKAQAVPKWVSVEDRLPPCDFEFCETGEQVSNVVLIHSAATYGFNMGMGHVNEDGVWNAYSGEHDFMNVLNVTHWMPLPDAPQEPAND